MLSMTKEIKRLSRTLIGRGAAMLLLGLAAVLWPEPVLVAAMLSVGIIASVFGLYEMSIAFALRPHTPRWRLALLHGAAALAFGILTLSAPAISLGVALGVIALWLLLYAGIAWRGALIVWPLRAVRWTLLAWSVLNIVLAIVAVAYPAATILALLFFGAAYATLLGAWQVAAGLWLRGRARETRPLPANGTVAAARP